MLPAILLKVSVFWYVYEWTVDASLQVVLFDKADNNLSNYFWISLHHCFGQNSLPGDQEGHN